MLRVFKSESGNHSNLRFNTYYQSPNKRYGIYLIALKNSLQSAENGGIVSDTFMTSKSGVYNSRFNIPVNLTTGSSFSNDLFNTALKTGTKYNQLKLLIRQQYDFGKKDSLVTDSTVIKLFYPRFRIEHTLQYNTYKYLFQNISPDSAFLDKNYHISGIGISDTIIFRDEWKEIVNDFSIYQFPDIRNQEQFLKLGAGLQNLSRKSIDTTSNELYNILLHAEYRNRTRNKNGYFLAVISTGPNARITVPISLRGLSEKLGAFCRIQRKPNPVLYFSK